MGSEAEYGSRSKRRQGYSLVELLVAMAILAVALIAVSAMLLFASSNVDYSGGTAQAAALAQRRLEEVRNLSFPAVFAVVTASNPPVPPDPVGPANLPASTLPGLPETITVDNTSFTVRTWVQLDPDPLKDPPYREAMVTVIVSWTEPNLGGAKSLRLDTLVAE